MASVVYSTPGKPYLTPTEVTGTSGTLLAGIDERDIILSLEAEVRERRTGVGASAGPRIRMGRVREARLIIPLRQQDATGLKLQFAHLSTDGATMRPTGGTATLPFAKLPTFALIVRPDSTSEKYIYSPNWALGRGSLWLLSQHETIPQLGAAVLELVATRPTNATGPAYMWASSSAIASAYSLTENPA